MAAAIVAIAYCFTEAGGKGDLYIFLSASGGLLRHQNIFEMSYIDSYNYFYSVLFALSLEPFYVLPYFWVKFCWLLLNVFLYAHLFQLMAGSKMVELMNAKHKKIFLLLVFIFSLRFLHDNIHASQVTVLILWCCVYGLYRIHHRWPVSGSALLALGINIKLLPIVFLPYLLYRGYFKAFALTLLFYCLSLFGPSLVIGHSYNMTLLRSWLSLINPVQPRHVLDVDERSFHGLSTLMATLLVKQPPDLYALPIKRNISDVSLQTLATVLSVIRLALISFTLYFLKWPPFRSARSMYRSNLEISYLLLLIPLVFPHQQHYAFLFIVPAFALSLYCLLFTFEKSSKKQSSLIIGLLSLIYLTGNLKLILGTFNNYYEHFKILTYGTLLLIPVLVWVSRKLPDDASLLSQD